MRNLEQNKIETKTTPQISTKSTKLGQKAAIKETEKLKEQLEMYQENARSNSFSNQNLPRTPQKEPKTPQKEKKTEDLPPTPPNVYERLALRGKVYAQQKLNDAQPPLPPNVNFFVPFFFFFLLFLTFSFFFSFLVDFLSINHRLF